MDGSSLRPASSSAWPAPADVRAAGYVQLVVVSSQPRLYFRPENGDAAFIASLAGPAPFDAAILAARYLAPYPPGGPQGDPEALPEALARRQLQFIVDPGTPELVMPSFAARASERHRESPIASALPLPLTAAALRDQGGRAYLLEIVLSTQTRAAALVPPYLELQARDNGELELNLLLFSETMLAAAGKRVVSFLQCTPAVLRSGRLTRVAADYGRAGADHVFLRVRGLRNERLSPGDFECYLDAVDAFAVSKIELTIDCAGQAGPPFVSGRARGFSSGWLHFHSVARRPFGPGGGGGEPGGYTVPGSFAEVVPVGTPLPGRSCPVAGCRAHEAGADSFALRQHFLHLLRYEANLAASLGQVAYGERLRAAGGYAAGWGAVLLERSRRAA